MCKFEIGKKYQMRSICDSDCKWTYEVIKRTDKTVWLSDGKETTRVKIYTHDNSECVRPLGVYSMAPVLRAERKVA